MWLKSSFWQSYAHRKQENFMWALAQESSVAPTALWAERTALSLTLLGSSGARWSHYKFKASVSLRFCICATQQYMDPNVCMQQRAIVIWKSGVKDDGLLSCPSWHLNLTLATLQWWYSNYLFLTFLSLYFFIFKMIKMYLFLMINKLFPVTYIKYLIYRDA